jgi:hypothetical protein
MPGELTVFLGLQVTQTDKGIFISQTKYIKEMLKKFQMEDCKPMSTPMVTGCKLILDDDSPKVVQTMYRSMVGIMLYETTKGPDIIQVVGLIGRFQCAPKETHFKAVKRIFRYLRATLDFGLWYPKTKYFTLNAYTDVYWDGSVDDRKSTNGREFFLGNFLVSWLSKKQTIVSLSTTKAKYIVFATCYTQVIWMKKTLEYLQLKYDHPILLNCDNTSAINLYKNLVMHSKTKHIPIKYHFSKKLGFPKGSQGGTC